MSGRWKRNAAVAAMAVLVCAAAALNWKYTGEQAAGAAADAEETGGTKILGEATLVSGQEDGGETDVFQAEKLRRNGVAEAFIKLLEGKQND